MTAEIRAAEIPMREWPKAWRGKEVTVSVIDSGVPRPWTSEKHGELMLADLATGASTFLPWARVRNIRTAQDGQRIAFAAQQGMLAPAPDELLSFDRPRERFRPVIVDPQGGEIPLKWQQELPDITPESLRWSPDGQHVLFLEVLPVSRGRRLFTASAQDGMVIEVEAVPVTVAAAEWTSAGDVLVRAHVRPGAPERPDWWILPRPSSGATPPARNLTAKVPAPPPALIPTTAGDLVGISGGALWKISIRSDAHQRLTPENVTVAEMVWPLAVHDRPVSSVVVSDKLAETATLTSIDVSTGAARAVRTPRPGVTLAGHSPESGAMMYSLADATGSTLWLANTLDSAPRVIVERNTFLREVAEGETRLIEYRSLHGEDLKAWLILPRGYRQGHRYPLITWPYLGTVARDSARSSINRYSSLNLQILSSGGYAVLLPSMPIKPRGVPRDPLMELQNGVIPALDKVIELGIADPKRLGIMGQSFGGYSTYGLVTQTRRFKVAVALAGLAELISLYGELDPRLRYDDQPFDNLFQPTLFETGQVSLGVAPWQDSARYLRNSPLFYVERVETPIMIIQGDLDYVTMAQGEQFFTALVRQNKRARFLRYWGEGHVLETQANTRDMWKRIFRWFDEFIGPGSKPQGSAAR
jgi:dipeptidyl aminopeptidase/acylaminoacyl peptidase